MDVDSVNGDLDGEVKKTLNVENAEDVEDR